MFNHILQPAQRTPDDELTVTTEILDHECDRLAAKLSALAQTARDSGAAVTDPTDHRTASEIISALVQEVLLTVGHLPLGRLTGAAGRRDLLRLHLQDTTPSATTSSTAGGVR